MVDIIRPNFGTVWAASGEKLSPTEIKIQGGWIQEMMPYQYQNFLQNRVDNAITYILQKGVPEWDASQEYTANKSVVTYSGQLYMALTTNTNVLPIVTASWKKLTVTLGVNGALPVAFGGTGATNAADARTNLGIGSAATVNLPTTNGMVVKLVDNSLVARSITGTTGYITVTNPDGVSGSPTINVGANVAKTDADAAWTTNTSIRLPAGSTAEQGAATPGRIRFNLETDEFHGAYAGGWGILSKPATAAQTPIVDAGGYYDSSNVEGALQEIAIIDDNGAVVPLDAYVMNTRGRVEALETIVITIESYGGKEGDDCTLAFNSAIAFLHSTGGGTLNCRLRNYKISAPVTLYDNITVDLHNGSPEFVGTGSFVSALYNAARTSAVPANPSDSYYSYAASISAGNPAPAIAANAMRGANSIQVDSAAGLAAGDYIYVSNGYCDMWRVMEQYTGSAQNWVRDDVDLWRCEIVQIKSISGNVLTLEDRLKNDYPVTVKTYGLFSDENALAAYSPWNRANVERLGGARNVKLKNAQAINSKVSGEAVTAYLCVGFETENFDVVSSTASGIHYYTCLDSHMLRNKTDTMGFSQSIRRGSAGCTMQSPRGVYRANDCPLIIWEGANDCHGSNIRVMGSGGEVAHAKIGFYINACWDCSADGVYAENVRSAAMIGFCRGNTHIRNITGRNVDMLGSVFRSFDWSIEGGNQSGRYTTAYTEYTERLCIASESHRGRIANLQDQDAYSASASGRLHLYKSFGIQLDDVYAPNVDLSSLVADDVLILLDEVKFEASKLTMRNARTAQTYAESIAVNVRAFKVRKSQFMQGADVNAIHNADFDKTVLYGRDVTGATLKLGISHYVRFTNGRILGNTGIDFRALGSGAGSEGHTSLIIFDGTTNDASVALVNYVDPSYAAYIGVMSTYGVGVSHVSTLSWLPQLGRLEGSGKSAAGWVKNNTAPVTVSTTTAALSSATNPINAAYLNKWIGREVFNTTTELFMKAVGNESTAYWVQSSGGGTNTIVPV